MKEVQNAEERKEKLINDFPFKTEWLFRLTDILRTDAIS